MSKAIISSICKNKQLRGSLFQAAKELAHRADGNNGQVSMSYSLLAAKCHQSRRTAIRHIAKLIDMGIIRVQKFWGPNNHWGINKYVFLIRWERPAQTGRNTEHLGSGDNLSSTLPNTKNTGEREKFGSLKEEEKMRKDIKDWLTPGSKLWKLANEF